MRVPRLTLAALAVVLLAVGGFLVVRDRAPAQRTPAPRPSPTRTPVMSAYADRAPDPTASGIARVLESALRDPALGGSISASVVDPVTGAVLYERRADDPVPPASTAKIATSIAALTVLGPDTRLETTVVLDGSRVVLVGGGDPTLAGPRSPDRSAAHLTSLAVQTVAALRVKGIASVEVGYDTSLFRGPATAPGWRPGYVTEGDVAPVTALEVDEGRFDPGRRARTQDPAGAAAGEFAALLRKAGVRVVGTPARVPASDSAVIARVQSPPVAALVEHLLTVSDNDLAEALARQVAIRRGGDGSFAGGAAAVTEAIGRLGVPTDDVHLVDGSGLSRDDRLTARLLARLTALVSSPQRPELRPVLTGLPIAGFTGTLDDRYRRSPAAAAAGVVRAKTGTLAGVNSLAGVLVDRDGRLLAFALVADHAPAPDPAEAALDRVAARLAACGCR